MSDEMVEKALNFIRDKAADLAKAKGQRVELEEMRKVKKAVLFRELSKGTIQDRESYAYSHPEYIELIKGLAVAVEQEEVLKWQMKAAEYKFEQWRTLNANKRSERGRYGA